MKERYEFRIRETYAHRLFGPDEGKIVGSGVRKIIIAGDDPRFAEIGRVEASVQRENGNCFYFSWRVSRSYTRTEMAAAALFRLSPLAYFEPAGEECGTAYADEEACEQCGAGARQTGPLFLPIARIPKRPDIAVTVAGEVLVNERLANLLKTNGISGATFSAVRQKGAKDLRSLGWHQLNVQPPFADITLPTRAGITPFDDDVAGEHRCPHGDTIGLNLLSEVTISASSRGDADIVASRQFLGRRAGLLRPLRCIFVSQKVRHLFEGHGVKGYRLEVVRAA